MSQPPRMMTYEFFKKQTTTWSARGRGALGQIDGDLLKCEYFFRLGNKSQFRVWLLQLVKDCQGWLDAKAGKQTKNANLRREKVKELAGMAYARLKWEVFEQNKQGVKQGHPVAPVRQMQGVYAYEASTRAKGMPRVGASDMRCDVLTPDFLSKKGYDQKTGFDALTEQEYRELEEKVRTSGGSNPLPYFSKVERLGYMLLAIDGKLMQEPNVAYDTQNLNIDKKGIYTVDKYGNYYVERLQGKVQNHSCFNRGLDVICAGEIMVHGGKPVYINNGSGHYRPTVANLRDGVRILADNGFNMDTLKVEDWSVKGRTATWNRASSFLMGALPNNVVVK